jgi:uncharacterized protein YdiU (UPF0061 family)
MLNYVVETFFPSIWSGYQHITERYLGFFREVVLSTARLVAEWCVLKNTKTLYM